MKTKTNISILAWGILVLLALTWGSSFLLMKYGLKHFSWYEVSALRITIAFLFLLPFSFNKFKRIQKHHWKWLVISGFMGNVIPAFLFTYAQTGIDSSLAGILNSLTPLFTLIVGISFFAYKTRWINISGVVIALIGAIGLISISGDKGFEVNFWFSAFIVVATICYALNVNIIKSKLYEIDPISITSLALVSTGLPVLIYLFGFTDFIQKVSLQPQAWEGIGYVAVLAIVGTALALMLYNKLIQMTTPVFSSSVTYLIPIVALFLGISDGEQFKWISLIWIVMILAGVILVNSRKRN